MTEKIFVVCAAAMAVALPSIGQERFDTAEQAASAIIDAAEAHDSARLASILGPKAKGILTCGKPTQDRDEQSEFARMAKAKHRLEMSPMTPNRAVLAIGDEDWPFPVPLTRMNGKWSFDASETMAEMRARHVGADELDAIEICHGYVDAQRKYAGEDRDHDGMLEYSQHLMSTAGKQDGLYWKGTMEPLVPEGFARSGWEGTGKESPKPYHGYYFKILVGQGPNAAGGEHTYLAKGKLIGGFALVAWPAEYGVTGIHTFIVNQDGAVYEKDIEPAGVPGRGTPRKSVTTVTRFDPDSSWERVE